LIIPSPAASPAPACPQAQDDYNRAAIQIAFVAGCFYFAVGLLRLGELPNSQLC
jgi:sulfate transporter 4